MYSKDKWSSLLSEEKMEEYLKRWSPVDNKTFDLGPFIKFAYPLVRKDYYRSDYDSYFPLSHQPVSGPVSSIYYLDLLYGNKIKKKELSSINPDFVGEKIALENKQEELFKEPVKETRASLLGPWCVPCGSDTTGVHRRMCPKDK